MSAAFISNIEHPDANTLQTPSVTPIRTHCPSSRHAGPIETPTRQRVIGCKFSPITHFHNTQDFQKPAFCTTVWMR